MVRFFLSPLAAAESVDATDGLKLTLALSDYTKTTSHARQAAPQPCQATERTYTVSKAFEDGSKSDVAVKEDLCLDAGISWRDSLWQEVAKATIRQPRGASLMRSLKSDYNEHRGLPIQGRVTQSVTTEKGEKLLLTYNVTTKESKTATMSANAFLIPDGYTVISPEQLTKSIVAESATQNPKVGQSPNTKGAIVDAIKATFFCAIAATTTRVFCSSLENGYE
jgi:hypothetical protein